MLYVTGDFHGDRERFAYIDWQYAPEEGDALFICGDFGYLWDDSPAERVFLDSLERRPYTICFIDGNHENFPLLNSFPEEEWNGGRVHRVRRNVLHLMRGQYYEIDGRTFFTMGGAASIDKAYRTEGESWWPEEVPDGEELWNARQTLAAHDFKVDYVLTHTAPDSVIYQVLKWQGQSPRVGPDRELTRFLEDMKDYLDFRHWYFGHFHGDRDFGKFTLLYVDVRALE